MQSHAQLRPRGATTGSGIGWLRLLAPRSRHGRSAALLALVCCGWLAVFGALATAAMPVAKVVADWALPAALLAASSAAVGAGLLATVAVMHEDERSPLVRLALLLGWLVLAVATGVVVRP